jgi:hypothetical protein
MTNPKPTGPDYTKPPQDVRLANAPDGSSPSALTTAIKRTRNNALQQLAIGVLVTASFIIWRGHPTLTIIFVAINILITFIFVRRLWRLRRSGPAMKALLSNPDEIASIHAWPRKLPPERMPVFLDVFTKTNEQCTLLLDAKRPDDTRILVAALMARSPNAIPPTIPAARVS